MTSSLLATFTSRELKGFLRSGYRYSFQYAHELRELQLASQKPTTKKTISLADRLLSKPPKTKPKTLPEILSICNALITDPKKQTIWLLFCHALSRDAQIKLSNKLTPFLENPIVTSYLNDEFTKVWEQKKHDADATYKELHATIDLLYFPTIAISDKNPSQPDDVFVRLKETMHFPTKKVAFETFYSSLTKLQKQELLAIIDAAGFATTSIFVRWEFYDLWDETNPDIVVDIFNRMKIALTVKENKTPAAAAAPASTKKATRNSLEGLLIYQAFITNPTTKTHWETFCKSPKITDDDRKMLLYTLEKEGADQAENVVDKMFPELWKNYSSNTPTILRKIILYISQI